MALYEHENLQDELNLLMATMKRLKSGQEVAFAMFPVKPKVGTDPKVFVLLRKQKALFTVTEDKVTKKKSYSANDGKLRKLVLKLKKELKAAGIEAKPTKAIYGVASFDAGKLAFHVNDGGDPKQIPGVMKHLKGVAKETGAVLFRKVVFKSAGDADLDTDGDDGEEETISDADLKTLDGWTPTALRDGETLEQFEARLEAGDVALIGESLISKNAALTEAFGEDALGVRVAAVQERLGEPFVDAIGDLNLVAEWVIADLEDLRDEVEDAANAHKDDALKLIAEKHLLPLAQGEIVNAIANVLLDVEGAEDEQVKTLLGQLDTMLADLKKRITEDKRVKACDEGKFPGYQTNISGSYKPVIDKLAATISTARTALG